MSSTAVYTTLPECTAATLALQRQPEIAVDIEGVNLCRNGILSLLQIADPDTVHIFDITQLGAAAFSTGGLRALLESPNLKIIFDGRADNDALFYLHNVVMTNVLDLQVFHAFKFSEDSDRYVKGLERCLSDAAPLPGMDTSEMKAVKEKGKRLFAPVFGGSYDAWVSRPLPKDLIEYAANDVKHLLSVKRKWTTSAVSHLDARLGSCLVEQVKIATAKRIKAAIDGAQEARGAHMARRDFDLPPRVIPASSLKRSRQGWYEENYQGYFDSDFSNGYDDSDNNDNDNNYDDHDDQWD